MDDFKTWLRAEWDRVAGYALIGLGGLALLLGFRGVSGSPFVAEELAYIASGGLGGLFLLGAGVTLILRAELHDQWRKLDDVESAIRERTEAHEVHAAEVATGSNGSAGGSANERPRRRAPLTPR